METAVAKLASQVGCVWVVTGSLEVQVEASRLLSAEVARLATVGGMPTEV